MQQKKFLEGSSQQYRPSRNKKNLKQLINIIHHLKQLEKEKQRKLKVSRRKEMLVEQRFKKKQKNKNQQNQELVL